MRRRLILLTVTVLWTVLWGSDPQGVWAQVGVVPEAAEPSRPAKAEPKPDEPKKAETKAEEPAKAAPAKPAEAAPQEPGPVGVISEAPAPAEPDLPEVTLNLAGAGCDLNLNEAELLRVKGIVKVDIEEKPGKVVVAYDPAVVTKQQIREAVGRKKGGCAASEAVVEGGGN